MAGKGQAPFRSFWVWPIGTQAHAGLSTLVRSQVFGNPSQDVATLWDTWFFGPTGGGSQVISLTQGSYTVTGEAQTLGAGINVPQGGYTLSGQVQTLGTSVSLTQGSYTLTGKPQTLGTGINVPQGSYSLVGKPQLLNTVVSIHPVAGSYILTGEAATLSKLTPSSKNFVLSLPVGRYSTSNRNIRTLINSRQRSATVWNKHYYILPATSLTPSLALHSIRNFAVPESTFR